ncbi:MAG: YdcF family protein [Hyphomicrobiaceae bacterium]|nr:YdcF family protein [Hyphomicrobiaceae bacterium]
MRRTAKALVTLAGFGLALVAFGFIVFASFAMREHDTGAAPADGIVVLTGAEFRIAEAAKLLRDGRGQRLLISGVNPRVSRTDLLRITQLPPERLDCCVDVGLKALDTIGNASETRDWVARHGYSSLILVTSSYHMPRSLTEFARAMPNVTVVPHSVVPRSFPEDAWWLHARAARILLSEYLKFLPSAFRLATSRLFGEWAGNAVAVGGSARVGAAKM